MEDKKLSNPTQFPVPWKQIVFVVGVGCAVMENGMVYGWSAVLPTMQSSNTTQGFTITQEDVSWLASLVPLAAIVGNLSSGPLVEFIGPVRLMLSVLIPSVGFWFLMALSSVKWLLYVGRAGSALCCAIIDTVVQPLTAELSSTRIRGLAGALPEVLASVGLLLIYVMAHTTPPPVATGASIIPLLPVIVLLFFVPESPYWLARRQRFDDARASLLRLYDSDEAVEQELSSITSSSSCNQASVRDQFIELRKRRNVYPVLLTLSFFMLRELGGRSAVFSYSVYIFRDSGVGLDAFTCTVLVGLARLGATCVASLMVDRLGRRPLLLMTALVCGLAQTVGGISLHMEVAGSAWVPTACILVFVASYGLGVGPIPWILSGELLPNPVRSLGISIITLIFNLIVFGVNYVFLNIIAEIGLGLTLAIFGVFNFALAAIGWRWLPESRGVSLQELELAFSSHKRNPKTGEENRNVIGKDSLEVRECVSEKNIGRESLLEEKKAVDELEHLKEDCIEGKECEEYVRTACVCVDEEHRQKLCINGERAHESSECCV